MADSVTTGNATNNTAAAPKKGRSLLIIILAVIVVGIGGWGGGYYFMQRGLAKTEAEKGKKPAKAEADAETDEGGEPAPKSKDKSSALALPDDSAVKQVVELQPYIVNLADPGEVRYLRLIVSVGIGGEGTPEEKPGPLFMARVRNAMLAVLTTKTSQEVLTIEGKAKLRRDLLRAARAASAEPKVEAVYITEFIVQL
jgi:flagellar FliL protein